MPLFLLGLLLVRVPRLAAAVCDCWKTTPERLIPLPGDGERRKT